MYQERFSDRPHPSWLHQAIFTHKETQSHYLHVFKFSVCSCAVWCVFIVIVKATVEQENHKKKIKCKSITLLINETQWGTKWEDDDVSYDNPFNVEIPGLYTCQRPHVWLKAQNGQRGCLVRGCLYQAGRGVSVCLCPIACFSCPWLISGPTPLCFLPSVCEITHK